MTGSKLRALALASTFVFLTACTGSSTGTASSPSPASPSRPLTPTPSPSPVKATRSLTVDGLDVVSGSFVVATVATCTRRGSVERCIPHLVGTQDAGATWYDLWPGGIARGWALEHPDFLDPSHGWVVAADCVAGSAFLFRTVDGGRSWHRTKIASHTCSAGARIVPSFADPLHGWLLYVEPTGDSSALWRTEDAGKTWVKRVTLPAEQLDAAARTSATEGWVTGFRDGRGGLWHTTDAGATWSRVTFATRPGMGRYGMYSAIPTSFPDGTLVDAVTFRRFRHVIVLFERSTDGGATWTVVRDFSAGDTVRNSLWPAENTAVSGSDAFWMVPNAGGVAYRSVGSRWDGVWVGAGRTSALVSRRPKLAWALHVTDRMSTLQRIGPRGARTMTLWPPSRSPQGNGVTPITTLPAPLPVAMLGGSDALFDAVPAGHRTTTLQRRDPVTGRVEARVAVDQSSWPWQVSLAEAAGSVWMLLREGRHHGDGEMLRFDATSLRPTGSWRLDSAAAPGLAVAPDGIWVGTGRTLTLRSAETGLPLRTIGLPGSASEVVASPDGANLYVAVGVVDGNTRSTILQADAETGAVVARVHEGYADLGVTLAPTDDGVWVAAPTGMMGYLVFLRSGTLDRASRPVQGPNAVAPSFAAARLWYGYPGSGGVRCADPETGRTLGYAGFAQQWLGGPVVEAGSGLLTLLGPTLYRIDPAEVC